MGLAMTRLRYCLVDVFTDRPLAGNPLCVVLDPCPAELMQRIAREVNLSETTFPVRTGDNSYEMRIFTPTMELPFAGHPSLGTAWLLGPGRWEQTTTGGTVMVEANEQGASMTQPPPDFTCLREQAADVVAALGLTSADGVYRSVAGGTAHILVPTSEPIDKLDPDLGLVAEASRSCGGLTLAPFRVVNNSMLHARVFAPAAGIVEDPGSGSAAGPIGLLARRIWGTDDKVTIIMGTEIGRPSDLKVDTADDIRVGGNVVLSAEGHFLV